MLYLDFNNEVQTSELINKLLYLNKIVVSPVTITDKKELIMLRKMEREGVGSRGRRRGRNVNGRGRGRAWRPRAA